MDATFRFTQSASALAVALSLAAFQGVGLGPLGFGEAAAQEAEDTIVVTGSRTPAAQTEIAAPILVITGEELRARGTQFVLEALRQAPGVAVNRSSGPGGLTQIRMRGSEANHVLVLLDGVELSDPVTGEFDFNALLTLDIERIEVLRGEASSLWGSDAIGGVISIITRKGSGAPRMDTRFGVGSFSTATGQATVSGGGETFDYLVGAAFYDTDGTNSAREGSETEDFQVGGLAVNLGWQPLDILELRATGQYRKSDTQFDSDSDFDGRLEDIDTSTEKEAINLRGEGRLSLFGGAWTHKAGVAYTEVTRDNFAPGQTGRLYGDRLRFDYQSTVQFTTDVGVPLAHTLTGAVEHEDESFSARDSLFAAAEQDRSIDQTSYVGEYRLGIAERVFFSAALREDDNDRFDDATTYSFGLSVPLRETGTRLHASYGTGIKNPSFYELFGFFPGSFVGNPKLDPETSKGFDIGVEQSFAGGRAVVDVTYFEATLEDEIFTDFGVFPSTARNRTTESERKGVEISLSASLSEALTLNGAYTYVDSEEDGADEARRPEHIASLYVNYVRGSHQFNLGADYNGEQEDNDFAVFPSRRVTLDAFTLLSATYRYAFNDRMSLFVEGDNLLDEDYEEVLGYTAPGASVLVGLELSFGPGAAE